MSENVNPNLSSIDSLKESIAAKPVKKLKERDVLTEYDQVKLLQLWNSRPENPPSLNEMARFVGKNRNSVREFMANRQLKSEVGVEKPGGKRGRKPLFPLTVEHKEFIKNNYQNTKNGVELSRVLFNESSLSLNDDKVKAVIKYILQEIDENAYKDNKPDEIPAKTWNPPVKIDWVINKVNTYANKNFSVNKLGTREKNNFLSLFNYLSVFRFIHQINTYTNKLDQQLFESEFIRCTYDKNDLSQEEIDQFIIYAAEVVISNNIQKRMDDFSNEQDRLLKEGEKISLTLVEATSSLRNEYKESVKRQRDLLNDLTQKRSERISKKTRENASILNLVNEWKSEEERKKMIQLAKLREQSLKEEYKRLYSLDELKAKILGVSESLLIDG